MPDAAQRIAFHRVRRIVEKLAPVPRDLLGLARSNAGLDRRAMEQLAPDRRRQQSAAHHPDQHTARDHDVVSAFLRLALAGALTSAQ